MGITCNLEQQDSSLLRPLLRAYSLAKSQVWDWVNGVTTCGDVDRDDLQMDARLQRYSAPYMAAQPVLLHRIFSALPLEGSNFRLVDFGSGKGRVLLIGMKFPFTRIEGIELDSRLNAIAESNLLKYRGPRRCTDVVVTQMDATKYEFPAKPTVIFLNSPFFGAVMQLVLNRLFDSLRAHPRDSFLVYVNPTEKEMVEESNLFDQFSSDRYTTIWRTRGQQTIIPPPTVT